MTDRVDALLNHFKEKMGRYPPPQYLVVQKLAATIQDAEALLKEHAEKPAVLPSLIPEIPAPQKPAPRAARKPPVVAPAQPVAPVVTQAPVAEPVAQGVPPVTGAVARYILITFGCAVVIVAGVQRSFSYVTAYFSHEGQLAATLSAMVVVGVASVFLQIVKEVHMKKWKNWMLGSLSLVLALIAMSFSVFATVKGMLDARIEGQVVETVEESATDANRHIYGLKIESRDELLGTKDRQAKELATLQSTFDRLSAEQKEGTYEYNSARNRMFDAKTALDRTDVALAAVRKEIEKLLVDHPELLSDEQETSVEVMAGVMGEDFEFFLNLLFAAVLELVVPIAVLALMEFGGAVVTFIGARFRKA